MNMMGIAKSERAAGMLSKDTGDWLIECHEELLEVARFTLKLIEREELKTAVGMDVWKNLVDVIAKAEGRTIAIDSKEHSAGAL